MEKQQMMRKIQRQVAAFMGVSLSFCLSLFGNATSGRFTVRGFIISFVMATIISLIIGWFVPMKNVSDKLTEKMGIQEGTFGKKAADALISDIIYTPLITFLMVFLAYKQATAHGAQMPFVPVFVKSLIESVILGFIIILILTPVFVKFVMKKNGIPQGGPSQGMPPQGRDGE